jgi:CRP-like cAMP-binding protein
LAIRLANVWIQFMNAEAFFTKVRAYTNLSAKAELAWSSLLRSRRYGKEEPFIRAGDVPTAFAFVVEGLLCQHYVGHDGDLVIKYFFPENRIAASVSATLLGEPSLFAITAIENSTVLEYDFAAFKSLVREFPEIAAFYISYMERHWIIEKEPGEIAFRYDDAMQRYIDFIRREPDLHKRLKQHHVAAWLGITPESLSRLRRTIAVTRPDRR